MEIKLLPGEEVRDVVGYEGLYKVSSYGGIWKLGKDGKVIKAIRVYREGAEYVRIPLSRGDGEKRKWYYPHRLVAMAFIPNPRNLPVINHIDGDKSNSRWDNLEWCTHYDNQQHATDTGLNKQHKLSAEAKYRLCEAWFSNQKSVAQLSEQYGIGGSTVYKYIKKYDRMRVLLTRHSTN